MATVITNPVLYWSSTLLDSDLKIDQQLQETGSSGIKSVLLWSLYVQSETTATRTLGDLFWNDTPLVAAVGGEPTFDPENQFSQLGDRLKTLLAADTKVYNVFFSIGAGGVPDFATIQQRMSSPSGRDTLVGNFQVLVDNLPMINGFDVDDEDNMDKDTVADFTELLFDRFQLPITCCPCDDFEFWESCMEQVHAKLNAQPVARWNLQCYSGGTGNDPVSWANNIKTTKGANGVAYPDGFIMPGYAAQNAEGDGPGQCPTAIRSLFETYRGSVTGGFVWNSQHVSDNTLPCNGAIPAMTAYAHAIIIGLSG